MIETSSAAPRLATIDNLEDFTLSVNVLSGDWHPQTALRKLIRMGFKTYRNDNSSVIFPVPKDDIDLSFKATIDIRLFWFGFASRPRIEPSDIVGLYRDKGLLPVSPLPLFKLNRMLPMLSSQCEHSTIWMGASEAWYGVLLGHCHVQEDDIDNEDTRLIGERRREQKIVAVGRLPEDNSETCGWLAGVPKGSPEHWIAPH